MNIKKGDKIRVIIGKDSGKEGLVEKVLAKKGKIVVAGINIFKKHQKPKSEKEKGAIIDIVKPLNISKVQLICPKCGQITRVGIISQENNKIRICRKCRGEF